MNGESIKEVSNGFLSLDM